MNHAAFTLSHMHRENYVNNNYHFKTKKIFAGNLRIPFMWAKKTNTDEYNFFFSASQRMALPLSLLYRTFFCWVTTCGAECYSISASQKENLTLCRCIYLCNVVCMYTSAQKQRHALGFLLM